MPDTKLTIIQELLQIDELLRAGQGIAAKEKFHSLKIKKIHTPKERTLYANLGWRLSQPHAALKLLYPFVRPSARSHAKATDEERLEYAVSLIKIGATTEAMTLLKFLDGKNHPKVYLFQAFSHIATWEYEKAIEWLNKYLSCDNITLYERLVAKANLCAAMGFARHPDTHKVITETSEEAKKNSFTAIYGHVQITKTVRAVEAMDFQSATDELKIAQDFFSNSQTIESFFVRKWRAIIHLYQDPKQGVIELNAIRKEAKEKWSHPETVRDCDFYQALATRDIQLFQKLYFGTPFKSFRNRLVMRFKLENNLPETYSWLLQKEGRERSVHIELFSGSTPERKKLLKAGRQIAALLAIMASDFYRPMRMAYLHSHLFRDQYFNPISSPIRIRLAIYRARTWLRTSGLPLELEEEKGAYYLSSKKQVTLKIPQSLLVLSGEITLQKTDLIHAGLTSKENFTAQDACNLLGLSRRSVNRLLDEAISNGLITKLGGGNKIIYTWAQIHQNKIAA